MAYDVIIIGAGPAAFSAATFLARASVSVLVIGEEEKSGLVDASHVQNYPGFPQGIAGPLLLDQMIEQAKKQGAAFVHGEVTHAEEIAGSVEQGARSDRFLVRTAERKEYYAHNLLLAHGAFYMKANITGEKEYAGKGVHYCSLCDGPLYRAKSVVVLGNGNLAAEEALQLSAYAGEVTVVSHSLSFSFSSEYKKALNEKKIPQQIGRVKRIEGSEEGVTAVVLDNDTTVTTDAVFIEIGMASSPIFAQKLGLELNGDFVRVDEDMRTSREGVWAIGLARGGVNQIVKSVGDGGVAAVDIIKKLKGLPQYLDHT